MIVSTTIIFLLKRKLCRLIWIKPLSWRKNSGMRKLGSIDISMEIRIFLIFTRLYVEMRNGSGDVDVVLDKW